MKARYKSDIFKTLHEAAAALFAVGAISEEEMRESDRACLVPDVPKVSTQKPAAAARSGAPVYARGN
jgi:DNA-binding transcriptional regulator YiaG